MNDKRDGTGSASDSVQQIIAAIETTDRKLSEHLAASGAGGSAATIEKARASLREAIAILTPAAASEVIEEAGTTKRRVKIKAESEVANSGENPRSAPTKGTASRAKSTPRGNRASEGARPGREPNGGKVPNGSLLARLGAAADTGPQPPTPAEPSAEPAPPPKPENAVGATAERLAQLEAEIADLTEAVTAIPTTPVSPLSTAQLAAPQQERTLVPATSPRAPETTTGASSDQTDAPNEDDEIAEITIIGADGAPSAPARRTERYAPRIFREGAALAEEEAEVEIRGQTAGRPARRDPDAIAGTHKAHAADKSSSRSKWRLFRGSR